MSLRTPRLWLCDQRASILKMANFETQCFTQRFNPAACVPWRPYGLKYRRVVYGAGKGDVHKMYFEDRHLDTLKFITDAYRYDLSIDGGVLRDECKILYYGPNDKPSRSEQGNL